MTIKYDGPDPILADTYRAARSAAFSAYYAWHQHPDQWFDDAIQTAAETYYHTRHQLGHNENYSYVAARRQVKDQYFARSGNPLPGQLVDIDGTQPRPDSTPGTYLLHDDELRHVIQSVVRSTKVDVDRYVELTHYIRKRYSNHTIAELMGTSESNVATLKKQLRMFLIRVCEQNNIPIPDLRSTAHHAVIAQTLATRRT